MSLYFMYYVTGFWRHEEPYVEENVVGKMQGRESLQMPPLCVYASNTLCVEIAFVSKMAMAEDEWEQYFQEFVQDPLKHEIAFQMQMVVEGKNAEACIDRLIERKVLEKYEEQTGRSSMGAYFFDAYKVASGGKMHFRDPREWVMSQAKFDELRAERLCIARELRKEEALQTSLNERINLARDIYDIQTRFRAHQDLLDLESGITEYRWDTLRWKFGIMFDWEEIQGLEDLEAESIMRAESLSNHKARLTMVIERQRRLMGFPDKLLLTGILYLPNEENHNALEKFAQKGLLGSALRLATVVGLSVLRLVVVALQIAVTIIYMLLPFMIMALVFVLLRVKWSEGMLVIADMMNGQVGATLREVIMVPLTILDEVGSYVIPIFNLTWYVILKIPAEMIMWILRGEGLKHFMNALLSMRMAGSNVMIASKAFVSANAPHCQAWYCMNGTCGELDALTVGSVCLDPQQRELNLLPAFGNLRQSAGHAMAFVGEACQFLGLVANITLFPLTDPELWMALDRLVNAGLLAGVGSPMSAIARCALAGGVEKRPAMCTPDFGPSFDRLAEFGLHMGNVITHWMDAAYLLLFDRKDIATVCASVSQLSSILWGDPAVLKLFGKNQTVMVRMSSSAFAITDGVSSVFVNGIGSQIRKRFVPFFWPKPIQTSQGVARAWLPSTLGLMGCTCSNDATGNVQIQCYIAEEEGSTVWEIPVTWSLEMQAQWLTCERLRLVVQSIRWPHRRVMASTLNVNGNQPAECFGSQCLSADVAVYAIPICGAINNTKAMACFPEKVFTRGICFPYCMGLRLMHEGVQGLTMRGAMEWEQGVLMAMRNCVPTSTHLSQGENVRTTCRSVLQPSSNVQQMTGDEIVSGGAPQCTYTYSCSTLVVNKSSLEEYKGQPSTNLLAYQEDGAHLVLTGQPLVVAGDVHMRLRMQPDGMYVDFPTLVGNQVNEFTMEMNSPIGIPVVDTQTVASANEQFEKPGNVFMPVRYVSSVVPYNPGTLARDSMWYASNPSYDWLEAMAIYCRSEGKISRTQLMDLSSYARIRIWRVRYYDTENCYIAAQTQKHVCRQDVAVGTGLENCIPAMKSEKIDTSLYDMCVQNTEYNLWVESMEYYDESNIAVGVRRGTLADVGGLMNGEGGGKTVFYFFNVSNISQAPRLHDPWVLHQATDMPMCNAFKVLPDVGSVAGHGIAAMAYLFKTPVNLILNPFAILEMLESRNGQRCPENSLQHSALSNCGMGLLSLDAFFAETYAANEAMWNVGYWLLTMVLPANSINDNNNKEAQMFRSFLQGGLVVGEATKVVSIFSVVHSVEILDTGVQSAFLGNRRLLDVKGRAAGSLFKMLSGLKGGLSSLLSLSKSVAGMATMNMGAGMDFGMLLASEDPTIQFAGAVVSAPTIAWAQFTYQTMVPIVVDILGNLKGGNSLIAPIWLHIHDAADRFENVVQARTRRACMGIRIMLGYASAFGKALYHNCLAAQHLVGGTMRLILTLVVDLPLYRCLCVNPAGDNYMEYVQQHCMPLVPPTRKAFWQSTVYIVTSQSNMRDICSRYENDIQTEIIQSMDAWKMEAILSAESVGSLLDEIFVPEAHAGTCQNTVSNPSAMVLTPMPLTHYQVCGKTQTCKERCGDANRLLEIEVEALRSVNMAPNVKPGEYEVPVESPFFNRYATSPYVGNAASRTTDSVVAVRALEVSENMTVYGCKQSCRKTCVVAAFQNGDTLRVEYFCMPDPGMILSTVYSTQMDTATLPALNKHIVQEGTLRGVDFSLQNSHTYVLVYVLKKTENINVMGKVERSESHEVHAYKIGQGEARGGRILRSEDIASKALADRNVQHVLFAGGEAVNPTISNCRIQSITEVVPSYDAMMTFFLAVSIDVRSWIQSMEEDSRWEEKTHTIYAVFEWYDPEEYKDSSTLPRKWYFYPPCNTGCSTPDCGRTCQPNVQTIVNMASTGTFVHITQDHYLFLPVVGTTMDKSGKRTTPPLRVLRIHSRHGYMAEDNELSSKFVTSDDNNNMVGSWTRASIFGSIPTTRTIRSSSTHTRSQTAFPLFFQAKGEITGQWLQEMRFLSTNAGMKLVAYTSQNTSQKALVSFKCTPLSCGGCATSKLRLLCHQAQNCALVKCVGTLVQTRNVLCGVGSLIEKTYLQAITTWHAMFLIAAELGLLVGKGILSQSIRVISLKFPTEQFYSLLCACKDMLASVVGVGMSVGEMMVDLLGGKGLDLTGHQDIGMLSGERFLKTQSMGAFFFNCMTGVTLLPLMAVHRWILCMANSSLVGMDEIQVSIQFGDVTMDTSWMQCAHISSAFDILHNNNVRAELASVVSMFVSFVVTLVMGIGESILFGLELLWDSTVDFLIGMVFSIQDLLYTFNLRACKVPNYAQRYVLWCSCQDEAYVIPKEQRRHGVQEGALWCVGSMSITRLDGTVGIIYNPYTMEELSEGVQGVTNYINCLSENSDASVCDPPLAEEYKLPALLDQSVEPVAVWARCKSNYVRSTWDVGAGVLFGKDVAPVGLPENLQKSGMQWALNVGPDFLECMQTPGRLDVDYTVCMRLFFSRSPHWQSGPNAYYTYEKATSSTEPPDACLVFSGLLQAAPPNSSLQKLMYNCSVEESIETTCDLIPSVWTGTLPHKVPVANLHGQVPPSHVNVQELAAFLRKPILDRFAQSASTFQAEFTRQARSIDMALFSADGDFIHEFFDCMFLGPYTRVQLLACDDENLLECPFYARDNASGISRNFTPCFGEVMGGDHRLPFTCGSQARRSVIKYFFRNFSKDISINVSNKIYEKARSIIQNYTNPESWGCWDPTTGTCRVQACTLEGGYGACLDADYRIAGEEMGSLLIETVLGSLEEYFEHTLHDTAPWTTYYQWGGTQPLPAQWGKDALSAAIAEQHGLLHAHTPLVTYNTEEVYSMPSHEDSIVNRTLGSLWGICTSLLSQTAMTMPLRRRQNGDESSWAPAGWKIHPEQDMNDLESVRQVVQNMTRDVAMKHCPFTWHKAKRHAPSPSGVCTREKVTRSPHEQQHMYITPVSIQHKGNMDNVLKERVGDDLTFPLFGFTEGYIGDAEKRCVCALNHPNEDQRCIITRETCESVPWNTTSLLREVCNAGSYPRERAPEVLACLQETPHIRCPELGPSDWWGLFPVDCTHTECSVAQQWVGTGSNPVTWEATRFLNDGRGGMRLPNFKYVNNTYHQNIHYAAQDSKVDRRQPQCWNPSELNANDITDRTLEQLFPAAQAVFDSPVTAACARYVVETVRAEAMNIVSETKAKEAEGQAYLWKRKCAAKIRQLAACQAHGMFYDIKPPQNWESLVECGGIILGNINGAYLTPNCVVVDQIHKRMYDAHLCVALQEGNKVLTSGALFTECELNPQPLDLLQGTTPYGMTRWPWQDLMAVKQIPEWSSGMDFSTLNTWQKQDGSREHISHILDWWPETTPPPVGYHPTAASDTQELAPMLFDSHFVYDPVKAEAYYVHSSVRNGSLLFDKVGAGGLCRSPQVNMPMFDANTNRICTHMARKTNTPTFPVQEEEEDNSFVMGAVTNTEYIRTHYYEERCANTAQDVPWKADLDDFQSASAGGILGWQHFVSMDETGVSRYKMEENAFPPMDYRLPDILDFQEEWGTKCKGVRWGEGKACSTQEDTCPWGISTCLPLNHSTQGICFSTSAYVRGMRNGIIKTPCFRTTHCADGLVCLAEGGCSPLHVHVWNDDNTNDMETSILSDTCGWRMQEHPFTQVTRGASPWEQVPDMLLMHGLCGHRYWFAYQHAMTRGIDGCETTDTFLRCNQTIAEWPWVTLRGDGKTVNTIQKMKNGPTLLVHAHPCDTTFMHLQNPWKKTQRLKVCSGTEGESSTFLQYALHTDGTWQNSVMEESASASTTHWLRTYREETDEVEIGKIITPFTQGRLGFLGGDATAEGVLGEMGNGGKHEFFRCADRLACSSPPFTYNGMARKHRLVLYDERISNMSETSLRRCGAIGHLVQLTQCTLDIPLFPLFAEIMWGHGACGRVWHKESMTHYQGWIIMLQANETQYANVHTHTDKMFCTEQRQCRYAPRSTDVLSQVNEQDSVQGLTRKLNTLLQEAGQKVLEALQTQTATQTYENINMCMGSLMQRIMEGQMKLQEAYDSAGPSGLYVGFALSLHEIPLAWLHHAMLVTILHHMEPELVAAPALEMLGIVSVIHVDLWNDKSTRCSQTEKHPLLWDILCQNIHPVHSFAHMQLDSMSQRIAQYVQDAAREAVTNEIFTKTGPIKVFCQNQAAWKCSAPYAPMSEYSACRAAMEMAYSNECDLSAVRQNPWLQVCEHPELFELKNKRIVDLPELLQQSDVVESEITSFFAKTQSALLHNIDKVATIVDYVREQGTRAKIVKFETLDVEALVQEATANFNLTAWLHGSVCHASFEGTDICKKQHETRPLLDECLYPGAMDTKDMNRYVMTQENEPMFYDEQRKATQPWVVIEYRNTDAATGEKMRDVIPLCDLRQTEQCIVQHFGDSRGMNLNVEGNVVSCDIDTIHAPPGVQVQAFAWEGSEETWTNILQKYDRETGANMQWCTPGTIVHSCIWSSRGEGEEPDTAAWGMNEEDGFRPYRANFDELEEKWGQQSTSNRWNNEGCGQTFNGFCSLRIRLENNEPYNRTFCGESNTGINCNELLHSPRVSTFRVVSERFEDTNTFKKSLFRCSDCTRFTPAISEGLFGCYISKDDGLTAEKEMSTEVLRKTLDFLWEPLKLKEKLSHIVLMQDNSTHALEGSTWYTVDLVPDINPTYTLSLQRWTSASPLQCTADPAACWKGYDATATTEFDRIIWNKAVASPPPTMVCNAQQYTEKDQSTCNARIDTRRQQLHNFVENQYRKENGVWWHRVPAGKGIGWRANVAHSTVQMFSVLYASATRKEEDKPVARALGKKVCNTKPTNLQDRICVQGANTDTFEAMHPWVGGDFNPFEGLDECPGSQRSLCGCGCTPARVCDQYNTSRLAQDFPTKESCQRQAYPQVRTMSEEDVSHVCYSIQHMDEKRCMHTQGMLGSSGAGISISTDQLHSVEGVPTIPEDYLIQTLMDTQHNGLWYGQTLTQERRAHEKYAFLRMPREHLHPAHVAFGLDREASGNPLVIKSVALLSYGGEWKAPTRSYWIQTLNQEYERERAWMQKLYPQLKEENAACTDWSCPMRAFAFWGGTSTEFAPITPDPIVTQILYPELNGAHPLIQAASLRAALVQYETSNGACFYEKTTENDDGDGHNYYPNRAQIYVGDRQNQCGLRGMVRNLILGLPVRSKVVNAFHSRCNTHLDAPNVNTKLRSGEDMLVDPQRAKCGVLHRLTPFLMRTRGDIGQITRAQALTTRSEGGDCHMGRAFLWSRGDAPHPLIGRQCALFFKNQTHGISHCPQTGANSLPAVVNLHRAAPLTLREITVRKAQRRYRSDMHFPLVRFIGPGGVELTTPEVSFGTLYAASLEHVLADDLRYACKLPCQLAPWTAATFMSQYRLQPHTLVQNVTRQDQSKDASTREAEERERARRTLETQDHALWNTSNWTWTFTHKNGSTQSIGTVNKDAWQRNRYRACNASYHSQKQNPLVKAMTLCEPASTESLQTFCNSMAQFRMSMNLANCQTMGRGRDCLYAPGMFYLPYEWSTTNQEFAADTVLRFYQEIITQKRFEAYSINTLCPARSGLFAKIRELSEQQQQGCPGHQIEYLKDVFKTFKKLGHDLLYMGFCAVMAGANLLGMIFAETGAVAATMLQVAMHYVAEVVDTGIKVIMPILNVLINIIFGATGAGKVIQTIFQVLCELYNVFIFDILMPLWCTLARPVVGGIMKAISFFIRIGGDSTASRNMDNIMSAILGGDSNDVKTCLGAFNIRIPCSMVQDKEPNSSAFPNQPIATRCWVDTTTSYYTAGGGILEGSTTNSFLGCTVSDTCALDPLRFDSYENKDDLVPCVQCPPVNLADGGQPFGCNSYLKRCTCGVRSQAPGACLRNSDCTQQSITCSVTSQLDFARATSTAMPCAECHALGAEAVCVMDGAAPTGVCACMDVRTQNSFHECTHIGENIPLLSEGWCLSMTAVDQKGANSLVFSELSVAPCGRGGSNVCMNIQLPVLSSARQNKPLVVLVDTLSAMLQPSVLLTRRLLSLPTDREWCQTQYKTEDDVRDCVFWKMMGGQILLNHSLDEGFLVSSRRLLRFAWNHPSLLLQLAKKHKDVTRLVAGPMVGRILLSTDTLDSFYTDNKPTIAIPQCVALQVPLNKIIDAFWTTIEFYEKMDKYLAPTGWNQTCNNTGYKLPDTTITKNKDYLTVLADLVLALPTGGITGSDAMDALLSPMSYEEAVNGNYFTGRRFIKEISFCNFTALTYGPPSMRPLLPLIAILTVFFLVFIMLISPNTMITWALWVFVFPIILFWAAYNSSPMCWPMIPPRLPHDVAVEISTLIPDSFDIPQFLVRANCTARGRRITDDSQDPTCFKTCEEAPFLLTSWQDATAWWLCEIHTPTCRQVASMTRQWGMLQDMTSSLHYFANVLEFTDKDSDFVRAHRVCAIFTSYHVVFAMAITAFVIVILPSACLTIAEILSATLQFIMDANGAENT